MSKNILVAGGAGYIGSHVCKTLAAAGYTPVTLDNFSTGYRHFVKFGPLVDAAVSDTHAVRNAVAQHKIEAVIDLAGSIEVGESVKNPLKYYSNNLAYKINFLRTLQEAGVKAFVFSSTAAVYGEPQTENISESHPLNPKNPYGWSKLFFEQVLRDFYATGGPSFMALRYFNAAGASPNGDIGEAHEPESHLIPRACLASLGKIPALEIFGNDYPTPDKTAIRDYVHVMDLAAAHVLAVEALLGGAKPTAYNLGNGNGISVKQILDSCNNQGIDVPHTFASRRAGDPTRLVADSSSAKKELGWKPQYADVNDIIRTAYNWHKSRN